MEDSSDDSADELLALAASVASEARSLLGDGVIPRIAAPPAGAPPAVVAAFAADFARRFITPSVPVVLTGCCDGWPARGWDHAYLRSRLGSTPVHVALTPNGYADAVTPTEEDVGVCGGSGGAPSAVFAKPFEALQPFNEFVDALESPLDNGVGTRLRPVHYASHQDSSLLGDFAPLASDVPLSLGWADAAFGRLPASLNFWMGEDAAHTTVHADLFDNLYAVVTGEKDFFLLPPDEGDGLDRDRFRAAAYVRDVRVGAGMAPDEGGEGRAGAGGSADGVAADGYGALVLRLDAPAARVWWSPLNLEGSEATRLHPLVATVRAGELLYLPALWWHAVSQRRAAAESTVAVNWWYEGPAARGEAPPCR